MNGTKDAINILLAAPVVILFCISWQTVGCHAVPHCIGVCDAAATGEVDGGADGSNANQEGREGGEAPDVSLSEQIDAPDTEDGMELVEGCTPCEHVFPNCVEGLPCCMDVGGREMCNGMDDDCDGRIDEDINFNEDPRNCGRCGNDCGMPHAIVECRTGECVFVRCTTYYLDCLPDDPLDPETEGCETYCAPQAADDSVCDNVDNDCDCMIDEDVNLATDPDNCGRCGRRCRFPHAVGECWSPDGTEAAARCRIAACMEGHWDVDGIVSNGCEYECSACQQMEGSCIPGQTCCTLDGGETCNGMDDDCNGEVDEGNPGGGALCGTDVGVCVAGVETCRNGRLECLGEVGPGEEICDSLDNDCDGLADESPLPDENLPCGESRGDCEFGATRCRGGAIVCEGGVGPATEVCDGRDNDCDGQVDESPMAGEGDPCGSAVGECRQGRQVCQEGGLVCSGEVRPTVEICDGRDNDCNGVPDDPFDLSTDPLNCGACGNRCSAIVGPHTIYICSAGTCTVVGCEAGWWDLDANPLDCEYSCTYTGSEICDGRDNDCDGLVDVADPTMARVPNFCRQLGACAGAAPQCRSCGGVTKWFCSYGAGVSLDADCETFIPEGNCDGIDNDCDGPVDEAFPLKGTTCHAGTGACRRSGQYVCNASGDGVICNAVAGTPAAETCNGVDDDCDGVVDDLGETAWAAIGAVAVTTPGGVDYVFRYEASRPDATPCSGGTQVGSGTSLTTIACSRAGVQPWTNVDWVTAREACCNLNSDGQCHYIAGRPHRWNLCLAADWQEICESQGNNYTYPYGNIYNPTHCNGNDYDTDCPCPGPACPSTAGDQDEVLATGSRTACCSSWAGGCVYDMSGNVREWTHTERTAGYREIRGGAQNVPPPGLTCQFNFSLGAENFTFFNLGFRCCYY